jgi:molybdopterin converting factor small subunit
MPRELSGAEITVHVHLFDHLRDRIGQAELDLCVVEGISVRTLLQQLAQTHDGRFAQYNTGPTREPAIAVMILNGQTLRIPQDLDHELEAGDRLYLISPIAGG